MNKKIFTITLSLLLLLITAYSATAENNEEQELILNFSDCETEMNIGETYECTAKVKQNDEVLENFNFTINGPGEIKINKTTGKIEWEPKIQHMGKTHEIEVEAQNGTHEVTGKYELEVKYDANDFNIILEIEDVPTTTEAHKKLTVNAKANCEDCPVEVEDFKYDLEENPSGMNINENTGEITWTPSSTQIGKHKINVSTIPADAQYDDLKTYETFELNVTIPGLTIEEVRLRSSSISETIDRQDYIGESFYVVDDYTKPGEDIEVRVTIRNNLDGGDDELRNVRVELYSPDLYGVDESTTIRRITRQSRERITFTVYVDPEDLYYGDDSFELRIYTEGETREEGFFYDDEWTIIIDVERDDYELLITNLDRHPEFLCPGENIRIDLDLMNIGWEDLDNAGIRYNLPELDISEWHRGLIIDELDSRFVTRQIRIPTDTTPGTYFMDVTAYPRVTSSRDTITETVFFTVEDCEVEEKPEDEDEEEEEEKPITEPFVPGTPVSESVGRPTSIFDTESNLYMVLLTALVVLVLVGVILLLVTAFKK